MHFVMDNVDTSSQTMKTESIHHYSNPPVHETVLGVQFDLLPKLKIAHLGAFWKSLGPEWRTVNDAPEISSQFEQLEEDSFFPGVNFEFQIAKIPPIRLQIRNVAGDRMIQVQNGRLHYNWLRKSSCEYPRYCQIREEFDQKFASFKAFLHQEECGNIECNQWEVTYVNHISKGDLWKNIGDIAGIFNTSPIPTTAVDSSLLESFFVEWHFRLPEKAGRLHVQARHGTTEKSEVIVVTLTARGPLLQPAEAGLDCGLDVGRAAIVNAFTALTSPTAHKYWGRTS